MADSPTTLEAPIDRTLPPGQSWRSLQRIPMRTLLMQHESGWRPTSSAKAGSGSLRSIPQLSGQHHLLFLPGMVRRSSVANRSWLPGFCSTPSGALRQGDSLRCVPKDGPGLQEPIPGLSRPPCLCWHCAVPVMTSISVAGKASRCSCTGSCPTAVGIAGVPSCMGRNSVRSRMPQVLPLQHSLVARLGRR
jgi:hypothetical protein